MFRVGELDQHITFSREVKKTDGMGGSILSWEVIECDVWAKQRPLSVKESERFQKLNPSAMCLFVVRYRCDLLEGDKLNWNGVDYDIKGFMDRGRRSLYLEIYAERGTGQ